MNKIIFLDVDGVLNCYQSKEQVPGGFIGIESPKVKILRSIVDKTGASIVLTSSWKDFLYGDREEIHPAGKYLLNKLHREGLSLIGHTLDRDDRGHGIVDWLHTHPSVDSWIVLDDDIFPDYEECGIIPHLVKTLFYGDGLTEGHAYTAIEMLNKKDVI